MKSILSRITFAGIATFTLAACNEDVLASTNVARVKVFNASQIVVSNVKITTGEGSSFTLQSLQPGATSVERSVEAIHQNPMVQLSAGGKSFTAHPVEGFSGFNPMLPAGSYVINIAPQLTEGVLIVSVSHHSVELLR